MARIVTYHNPIVPGFSPDPSAVLVDGIFYLVTSSFHMFPGLPIYASKDLKKWAHIGNAINRPEQLSLRKAGTSHIPLDTGFSMVASGGLFAATIKHHKGKFYIVCTNAINGGAGSESIRTDNFVISTSDIWSGNWSNPVPITYTGIDPSLFFDDDGRAYVQGCYMLGNHKKQPSCTIKQFEVNIETGEALTEHEEIWGGHAKYDTEGPHIYKRGKWYYLLVAEGGTFEHHMLCIGRSENIWGPYDDYGNNPILTADGTGEYIQNAGHGDIFQDEKGQWWAVALAVRNEPTCQPLGRETFLAPVEWPEGGWPRVLQPKMEFQAPSPAVDEAAAAVWKPTIPSRVEDLYIGEPDEAFYKLPEADQGPFKLIPSFETISEPFGTSTFIGRRQRSLDATATTTIDLAANKANSSVTAGLTVYKDHMRHLSLTYNFDTRQVTCRSVNKSSRLDRVSSTQFMVPEAAKLVCLKVTATSKEYRFFAKAGEDADWVEVGMCETREICCREMTGPIFGVFANIAGKDDTDAEVAFIDLVNE